MEDSIHLTNSLGSHVGSAMVMVNLLVDPVLHVWTRALRIINYLLSVPKVIK